MASLVLFAQRLIFLSLGSEIYISSVGKRFKSRRDDGDIAYCYSPTESQTKFLRAYKAALIPVTKRGPIHRQESGISLYWKITVGIY